MSTNVTSHIMLATPPNSTELKSSTNVDPATMLELPEAIEPIPRKNGRKAPRRNHSEIERRRRERLNLKYNELRELVPACRAFRFARRGGDAGLHKLDILTEAVKYIGELEAKLATVEQMPPTPKQAPQHQQGSQYYVPLESLAQAASTLNSHVPTSSPPASIAKHNISYLMN